jgi:hypothetical protein
MATPLAYLTTIIAFLDYKKAFNEGIRNKVKHSMIEKDSPQH